ncbi:MAG: hypothetical protein AWU57_3342 [Marinobacter sp. T13-3]|nr:MAG: hypothetical protein AWU57_3342 [Marinobacter sp. T13-3]
MTDWTSYRLQDFVPFTEQVYFRLMERMGETFWPLHLLMLALGGTALVLALTARPRPALALMTPVWVFVAVAFFLQRYAQLNWAGQYVGYAFMGQAALFVLICVSGWGLNDRQAGLRGTVVVGALLGITGLIGVPLATLPGGGSWYQTQVFGIHPDPTALVSLGMVVLGLRGPARWLAAIVPVLWLVISGLTLIALHSPGPSTLTGGAFPG